MIISWKGYRHIIVIRNVCNISIGEYEDENDNIIIKVVIYFVNGKQIDLVANRDSLDSYNSNHLFDIIKQLEKAIEQEQE